MIKVDKFRLMQLINILDAVMDYKLGYDENYLCEILVILQELLNEIDEKGGNNNEIQC